MNFINIFVKFIWISQFQGWFTMVIIHTGSKSWKVLYSPGSCEYHGTFQLNMSYWSLSHKRTKTGKNCRQIRLVQFRLFLIIYLFLQVFVKHHWKLNAFIVQFFPRNQKMHLVLTWPETMIEKYGLDCLAPGNLVRWRRYSGFGVFSITFFLDELEGWNL